MSWRWHRGKLVRFLCNGQDALALHLAGCALSGVPLQKGGREADTAVLMASTMERLGSRWLFDKVMRRESMGSRRRTVGRQQLESAAGRPGRRNKCMASLKKVVIRDPNALQPGLGKSSTMVTRRQRCALSRVFCERLGRGDYMNRSPF